MNPLERADRIHDCVQDVYWSIRSNQVLRDIFTEIDIHIHKIIEDYERRGMKHADEKASEPATSRPSAPQADLGTPEGPVRGSGYLW